MLHPVHGLFLEPCRIAKLFLGPDLDFAVCEDLRSLRAQIRHDFTHERIALLISMEEKTVRLPPTGVTFDRIKFGVDPQQGRMNLERLNQMTATRDRIKSFTV